MALEIKLKKLLKQYGLDTRGVTQRIATDIDVHRHTIGKLYRGQAANPSLEVLDRLCGWLGNHGVPRNILPQALLGERPDVLWPAVVEPGAVSVYVGEYRQSSPPAPTMRWIVQHDALAMAKVVQAISRTAGTADRHVSVTIEYVPFRLETENPAVNAQRFEEDARRARQMFAELRATGRGRSSIILGSQRANHLTELIVADLFGCAPFETCAQDDRVPFYLAYRPEHRQVPSCFGGLEPPGGTSGPGICYLTREGWKLCRWEFGQQDAGLVLVRRDEGAESVELAAFGFSGAGTEALGEKLLSDPDPFWPPPLRLDGQEIGVYVCRFRLEQGVENERAEIRATNAEVIAIENEILEGRIGQ